METISQMIAACDWAPAKLLFFSENVFSPLVYYSHLFPVVLSLVVSGLLFFGNRKRLPNKVLFITVIIFAVWTLFDLVLWATPKPSDTVFFWSIVNMLEPLVYVGALYFIYSFVTERLPSTRVQSIIGFLLLPSIALAPTVLNITGFNLTNCDREAVEGALVYYNYVIEIIFAIWVVVYGVIQTKAAAIEHKKQIWLCTLGLALFLFSFAFGNIIGSISVNWVLGQVGLFGLPIFVAFLGVLVGKYHSFKTRIFSAEILVVILWVLIVSMLFVQDVSLIRVILLITLLITLVLGILLIKSVRREVSQKETLTDLNKRLTVLDATKNEFLSFATHQLRSPLTSIKWGLDALKADYSKETVNHLLTTTDDLISTVNDLLDISKIEQGGLVIKKEEFDLLDFVGRIVEEFRMSAEKKGLRISFEHERVSCLVYADQTKLRQVFVNLIDNAIKYTKEGSIVVSLVRTGQRVVVKVNDTGPGIEKAELSELFDKFLRGAAGKASQSGSGLGLYLAKKIVGSHNGTIAATSDGMGKGSTFSVELPLKN